MTACLAVLIALVTAPLSDELRVLPPKIEGRASTPESDGVEPSRMIHAHLMRRVRDASDRHDAAYEAVKTPQQAAAYQQRMRAFFFDQLGPLPPRSPLNARVVGSRSQDGYRVERVVFESQPKHYVTALLYLPTRTPPPFPGVLVPCGHSVNGKAEAAYQSACILLARNGLAALCYDPIDQGERHQLLDAQQKPVAQGTMAHCLAGVGSILLGRNTATYRVWDGMRAIDYLQSRPEVDGKRIGCTGNSGGGTLTSYLMALDDRIQCAAPSCYLTSFRRLMETIGPQDLEQNIHGQIAEGLGHAEYVLTRAPKPTLICCATRDFFEIGGTWETFRQAKRWYGRLGFAERMGLVETDAPHGFTPELRVGATRWMRRWLLGRDDAITEDKIPVAGDADCRCTPEGEVLRLPGARSVYDLNAELQRQLAEKRRSLWREDRVAALRRVRAISGIRPLAEIPAMTGQKQGEIERAEYRIEKWVFKPEADIWLPALAFVPKKTGADPVLYLHEDGKQAHAAPGGPIEKLVLAGHPVLAVDLRGVGETLYRGGKGYSRYLGPDWVTVSLAYMLGRSYLAMQAEDVLNCARYWRDANGGKPLRLLSVGRVGPAALHAAALEPGLFGHVRLQRCLATWTDVVHTPLAVNQYVNVVHGALAAYDLPDLAASLPQGKLERVEPLNALESPIDAGMQE